MKKLKSILRKGDVKWSQVLIIGFLAGIITTVTFKYTSGYEWYILGGLFILFFIYNIWVDNKKK